MGVKNITSPSAYDLLADLKYLATPTVEELKLLEIHKKEIPVILQNLKNQQIEKTKKENIMTEEIKTKKCSKCGEVKPITEFYKSNHTSDGYYCQCKLCHNSYSKKTYNQTKSSKYDINYAQFFKTEPTEQQNIPILLDNNTIKSSNNELFKDYLKIKIQSAKDLITKLQGKIETYQEILEEI